MLRINKLTDYATVVLACLAMHSERRLTATEIAERTHLGPATVSKLLKTLHKGGVVNSTRGSQGGYQLARLATQITAADILDALEGPFALTECSSQHSSCGIATTCRVGQSWQGINAAIHHALSDISLSQLAGLERCNVRVPDLASWRHTGSLNRGPRTPSE